MNRRKGEKKGGGRAEEGRKKGRMDENTFLKHAKNILDIFEGLIYHN